MRQMKVDQIRAGCGQQTAELGEPERVPRRPVGQASDRDAVGLELSREGIERRHVRERHREGEAIVRQMTGQEV